MATIRTPKEANPLAFMGMMKIPALDISLGFCGAVTLDSNGQNQSETMLRMIRLAKAP